MNPIKWGDFRTHSHWISSRPFRLLCMSNSENKQTKQNNSKKNKTTHTRWGFHSPKFPQPRQFFPKGRKTAVRLSLETERGMIQQGMPRRASRRRWGKEQISRPYTLIVRNDPSDLANVSVRRIKLFLVSPKTARALYGQDFYNGF